ncbi:MAG TPA: LysR family transcriptional regulator [Solirubrobacteraceae bacterium]|nr:LysR family transcriptional regulator [Solirubrobacteraceae bacterium]
MTLQQLEYFLSAYRHGSFSGAAQELHLAQPSLSEQVRRLEAELGVALFARVGRGLAPTEAGETLRPHAERTLAEAEAARESVVAVRELRGGIATFGTWGTARHYPGTDMVAEFRRRHPDVRVRLVGQNSFEVAEGVRAGDLEAGMVALPIDDRGLDVRPIMRDEIVYASIEPRRLRRPMTVQALAAAPLILPDASYGSDDPTRRQLAELAQREGVTIEPQIDVEDVEAAIELAARGLGDTIVSRGMLLALGRRVPRRLGWVPFEEPIYDQFAFVSRRGARLSPASREFVRLARERLEALAETLETRPPRRRRPGAA